MKYARQPTQKETGNERSKDQTNDTGSVIHGQMETKGNEGGSDRARKSNSAGDGDESGLVAACGGLSKWGQQAEGQAAVQPGMTRRRAGWGSVVGLGGREAISEAAGEAWPGETRLTYLYTDVCGIRYEPRRLRRRKWAGQQPSSIHGRGFFLQPK